MADEQKLHVVDEVMDEEEAVEEAAEEAELDLDGEEDLEGAMRDAVAAVEKVEDRKRDPATADEEAEVLRQEVAELRDRSVRALAELDNYRKRAERERQDLRRYALIEPMRDFLDVVDNLERAMDAGGSFEDLKTGVEMILSQMRDLLRQYGVKGVEAQGQAFDPNVHEAVVRVEKTGLDQPEVIQELQRGYKIHDRLLRPARVKVAVPVEDEAAGEAEA